MESKNPLKPFKRFINLLKVEKQDITSIYLYAIFNGIISLSLPLGIQAIINLISGGQVSTSWIILVFFVIAGVAITGILQIFQLNITENIQQKLFTRSAFEFAYRIPRMKLEAVRKNYVPELVNRFFDTLTVQKGLSKILIDFSSAILQVIFGLILLSLYHPFFIFFSVLLILLIIIIFRYTTPMGLRSSLKESKHKYEVVYWLEEVGRTLETFKLAGKSPLPMQKTDAAVSEYLKARKIHFRTLVIQYLNLAGFKVIIAAGLLLIGGLLVLNQQMNIGQFVASEIIIILVLGSVEKLISSMETVYDVLTATEKIGAVMDIPLDKKDGIHFDFKDTQGLNVRLKNLDFKFEQNQASILKNLNLNLSAGAKVCLSGLNGSGKTTLLQTIAALYSNFSGAISYNNIPLSNYCTEDLRSKIGDSLSKEDIFSGTILDNITLGKPEVSFDQVQELAQLLNFADFIEELPEGYLTQLTPEGIVLPRSVRTKIMLARCLAGNPQLILLEDNFNLLDSATKNKFVAYLNKIPATVLAISNDYETVKKFEKVSVIDNGTIVAFSSPDEIQNTRWYSEIYQNH